jgi:1-acyl-sn-glycerol-3-phosphate acyltransferase
MISVMTVMLAVAALSPVALAFAVVYPLSRKLCAALADWTVRTYPRLVFAILETYKRFRVRFYFENERELPDRYLVISNHQSLLDVPLYMLYFKNRARFVAKEELARNVPLISTILRVQEHCIVPRSGSPLRAMRVLDDFVERVWARAQIPVLFPEGTRSKDGSLGTFAAAGFRRILDRRPMPVAVFALDGGYKIATLDGVFRWLYNGSYRLKILKVYPAPSSKKEQMEILRESRELIGKQLDEWRGQVPATGII